MGKYIVEMTNIVKEFGDVTAISEGHFDLVEGEIHSLIGENGTGKSTMMKLLFGMYPPTEGTIKFKGEVFSGLTTNEAIEMGIGMVHQEFMLVDELTVLENIILGSEPVKGTSIDFDFAHKNIQEIVDRYNLDVDLTKKVGELSVGEAQRVEIIKVLSKGVDIVILDEPTAVLTPQETRALFDIINVLRDDGKSIVFISHKMDEVLEISDRISVMRKGKYVDAVNVEDANYNVLSQLMIGREVFLDNKKTTASNATNEMALSVQNLWVPGDKELSKIKDLNLEVKKGEVLGIAGIDGNGQLELEEAIAGLREVERGEVYIGGDKTTNLSPIEIRGSGLTYIPSDRNTRGLNRSMSIELNLISTEIESDKYVKKSLLQFDDITENAQRLIEDYNIVPNNPKALTNSQSGGNAQKVVVAREVPKSTDLLIASHPTRGVDIGAIEFIRSIIEKVSAAGTGVLLISADLGEILSLSDRIAVIYEGKIVATLDASEANEENLGMYMMGGVGSDDDVTWGVS